MPASAAGVSLSPQAARAVVSKRGKVVLMSPSGKACRAIAVVKALHAPPARGARALGYARANGAESEAAARDRSQPPAGAALAARDAQRGAYRGGARADA